MASVLQQKRFASFVVSPSPGESFYRVQVGPYPTESAADAAKAALVHDGFKAIVKH
jgi:cell division protein FtsN